MRTLPEGWRSHNWEQGCHYPNIDIDVAAEQTRLEVKESDLEIELNSEEDTVFIACTMSQEEINSRGMSHVVHKRRYKTGSRPGLKCEAITCGPVVKTENNSRVPSARRPTRGQKKKMIGCLIKQKLN